MSDTNPKPEHAIDALVRAYLERQEAAIDARDILAKVRQQASVDPLVREHLERQEATIDGAAILGGVQAHRRRSHGSSLRRWGWSLALAAGLFIAALITLQLNPNQASAETLVRDAQQAHALAVDRRYRIDLVADPAMLERFPLLRPQQEMLWTRGDRFWIEVNFPERRWAWGQDDRGSIWLACFPDRGVRFAAGEMPDSLAAGVSVRSLHFETLLRDVLQDFDLQRQSSEGRLQRIRAELKPGHTHVTLRWAELDIDPDTKVVNRLVLQRTFHGIDIGTVTFTLEETGTQPDAAYQLEGHVNAGAVVLTRDQRLQRMSTLFEHFGPTFGTRRP